MMELSLEQQIKWETPLHMNRSIDTSRLTGTRLWAHGERKREGNELTSFTLHHIVNGVVMFTFFSIRRVQWWIQRGKRMFSHKMSKHFPVSLLVLVSTYHPHEGKIHQRFYSFLRCFFFGRQDPLNRIQANTCVNINEDTLPIFIHVKHIILVVWAHTRYCILAIISEFTNSLNSLRKSKLLWHKGILTTLKIISYCHDSLSEKENCQNFREINSKNKWQRLKSILSNSSAHSTRSIFL